MTETQRTPTSNATKVILSSLELGHLGNMSPQMMTTLYFWGLQTCFELSLGLTYGTEPEIIDFLSTVGQGIHLGSSLFARKV